MPRMIDLVRKSQMSSNMMQAAARGALAVAPAEMIEILVHLALHNKVFGELARMTLAGWDEKASIGVASDPATSKEVLEYLISPKNLRPALLPALLENRSITEEELKELATTGSRTIVDAMLISRRVALSPGLIEALKSNPRLRANELAAVSAPPAVEKVQEGPLQPLPAKAAQPANAPSDGAPFPPSAEDAEIEDEQVLAQAIDYYLQANAAELATLSDKPFEAVRPTHEELPTDGKPEPGAPKATSFALRPAKKPAAPGEERRDSTLQKIAKLDVKGRIALAMRGSKEERSILIRDGTKLVALAVLDSPKISDGEVEKFALQKNVLEAVLRQIPLKRRFAKNYTIMRNLVFNPRTPIDLSLGLMKNLLVHDLKNLSGNKEVSETIRKLALRMFKQKTEKKKDD